MRVQVLVCFYLTSSYLFHFIIKTWYFLPRCALRLNRIMTYFFLSFHVTRRPVPTIWSISSCAFFKTLGLCIRYLMIWVIKLGIVLHVPNIVSVSITINCFSEKLGDLLSLFNMFKYLSTSPLSTFSSRVSLWDFRYFYMRQWTIREQRFCTDVCT